MELSKDFAAEIPDEMNSSNVVNETGWTDWWIFNFMLYNFYSACRAIGRDLVEVIVHRPVFNCVIFLCAGNIVVQSKATLDSSLLF